MWEGTGRIENEKQDQDQDSGWEFGNEAYRFL